MVDMTATGWDPAGAVNIVRRHRPWGPNGERQNVIQLNFTATNFGDGAHVYPSAGIPAPGPSTCGLREYISYMIPFGPFMLAGGAGAPSVPVHMLPWGVMVPTGGVSGAVAPRNSPLIRVFTVRTGTDATGGAGAEPLLGGIVKLREFTTAVVVSDIAVTGLTYTAFAMVVGK